MKFKDWQGHLERLKAKAARLIDEKYRAGQVSHGGELWRKQLFSNTVEEAVDQLVYTLTVFDQQVELRTLCVQTLAQLDTAVNERSWNKVHLAKKNLVKVANMIHFGNPEGDIPEEKDPPILEV